MSIQRGTSSFPAEPKRWEEGSHRQELAAEGESPSLSQGLLEGSLHCTLTNGRVACSQHLRPLLTHRHDMISPEVLLLPSHLNYRS